MGEFGIGQSVPREEDPYLVRGAGRYVDDVTPAGQSARPTCCARRMPMPASRRSTRPRAEAMPGVRARPDRRGSEPSPRSAPSSRGAAQAARRLAGGRRRRSRRSPRDRVRYIGDPVAFVVADTLDQAKDAAEAIEVDYETLPAVVDARGGDRARRAARCGTTVPTTSPSSIRPATRPRPTPRSPRPPMSSGTAW